MTVWWIVVEVFLIKKKKILIVKSNHLSVFWFHKALSQAKGYKYWLLTVTTSITAVTDNVNGHCISPNSLLEI